MFVFYTKHALLRRNLRTKMQLDWNVDSVSYVIMQLTVILVNQLSVNPAESVGSLQRKHYDNHLACRISWSIYSNRHVYTDGICICHDDRNHVVNISKFRHDVLTNICLILGNICKTQIRVRPQIRFLPSNSCPIIWSYSDPCPCKALSPQICVL